MGIRGWRAMDEPELPPDNVVRDGRFTSANAAEMSARGRQKAVDEQAERKAYILERIAISAELVAAYDEAIVAAGSLAPLFKAAATRLAMDVLTGKIEISGSQFAASLTALINAGRLEAGETTSSTQSVSITSEEAVERMKELNAEIERRRVAAEKLIADAKVVPMGGAS